MFLILFFFSPFRGFIVLKEENVKTQVTVLILETCFKISCCF